MGIKIFSNFIKYISLCFEYEQEKTVTEMTSFEFHGWGLFIPNIQFCFIRNHHRCYVQTGSTTTNR